MAAFLAGKLSFDRIVPLVTEVLDATPPQAADSLAAVLESDRHARAETERLLTRNAT